MNGRLSVRHPLLSPYIFLSGLPRKFRVIFSIGTAGLDCLVNSDYTTHNIVDKKPNTTNIANNRVDLRIARERRMHLSFITINSNEKGLQSLQSVIKTGVNILFIFTAINITIVVYNIGQAGLKEQTSYENLITIVLTALAVILTVMTVGLAFFSYFGYKEVNQIIEKTLMERVDESVKKHVHEYIERYQPDTGIKKSSDIDKDVL